MGCVDVSGVAEGAGVKSKRLLIVVNVDWFLLSHRLPVALGARQAGYEVHIATTLTQDAATLEAHGFVVHPLEVDRSGAGLLGLFKLFVRLVRLFWAIRPDVLHLVTIKPVLVGGLAARCSPVQGVVCAISGLGHVFVAEGFWGRLRRRLVGAWYHLVLGTRNIRVIFQNPDDRAAIESVASLTPQQVVMIPGSGVDLEQYPVLPLPDGVPVVLMAARLLATKGVREFVSAARQLRAQGVNARFWLAGDPDPDNPASVTSDELQVWRQEGAVELLGHQPDIAQLMAQVHMVVLPSYREGLPKVLIEAAACGRVVVTTDVPGCRDAVETGVTAVLVPAKNALALTEAIGQLLQDRAACTAMGQAGRLRAERLFDVNVVVASHLDIYRALEIGA